MIPIPKCSRLTAVSARRVPDPRRFTNASATSVTLGRMKDLPTTYSAMICHTIATTASAAMPRSRFCVCWFMVLFRCLALPGWGCLGPLRKALSYFIGASLKDTFGGKIGEVPGLCPGFLVEREVEEIVLGEGFADVAEFVLEVRVLDHRGRDDVRVSGPGAVPVPEGCLHGLDVLSGLLRVDGSGLVLVLDVVLRRLDVSPNDLLDDLGVLADQGAAGDQDTAGVILHHLARLHDGSPRALGCDDGRGWVGQEDAVNLACGDGGGGGTGVHGLDADARGVDAVLLKPGPEDGVLDGPGREGGDRLAYEVGGGRVGDLAPEDQVGPLGLHRSNDLGVKSGADGRDERGSADVGDIQVPGEHRLHLGRAGGEVVVGYLLNTEGREVFLPPSLLHRGHVGDLVGARLVADAQVCHLLGVGAGAPGDERERRDQGHGQKQCSNRSHRYLHPCG